MQLNQLFSAGAGSYDLLVDLNPGYHAHLNAATTRLGEHVRADRILDVGCGTGASTRALRAAAPHAHILGVDASSGMIDRARKKFRRDARTEFLVGFAGDADLTQHRAPFDAAFAAYLLRNVPPAERTGVLRRIAEKVRPGGVVVIQDYTVKHSWRSRFVWNVVCRLVVIPLAALTLRDTRLYRYLLHSVNEMEGVNQWCQRLREAGCEPREIHGGTGWQRGILFTVIAERKGPVTTPAESGAAPSSHGRTVTP